jgi:hypothetical protein
VPYALSRLAESTDASMLIVGGPRPGRLAGVARLLEESVSGSLIRSQSRPVVVLPRLGSQPSGHTGRLLPRRATTGVHPTGPLPDQDAGWDHGSLRERAMHTVEDNWMDSTVDRRRHFGSEIVRGCISRVG